MEARELRIGNIIGEGIIKSFYEHGVHVGLGNCCNFCDLHPIPLTEDWLNKMHAVYKEKNQYEIDRFLLIWKPGYKYWYVVDSFSKTYLTKVEFVHEFQNMYFVLNGEELKLTNNN